MKLALTTLIAAFALAIAAPVLAAPPPETVVIPSKNGDITFPHKAHMKQGCKACHPAKPEKITFANKEEGHKLCGSCHAEKKAGPQEKECAKCHKKA